MPANTAKALGARIREARKLRCNNLSLAEFGRCIAEELGRTRPFSNVTVSNWETGRQEPSWEALITIACLTRLPLEYFAGIGTLQDYPPDAWQAPGAGMANPHLVTVAGAVQRFSPELQRVILQQLETLLETVLFD